MIVSYDERDGLQPIFEWTSRIRLTGCERSLEVKITMRTLDEVQQEGYDAVVRTLGLADAVRFFQSIDNGSGDYVKERYDLLGDETVEQIAARIRKRQESRKETVSASRQV